MAKRLFFVIIVLAAALAFFISFYSKDTKQTFGPKISQKSKPDPRITPVETKSVTIFVPYWTVEGGSADQNIYDRSIYFGVSVNKNGINKQDTGYLNLQKYIELFPSGEKLLAIRMIDSDLNLEVLADKTAQEKIISDAIETALQNNFLGLVLDLELFSLFDDQVPKQINSFVSDFYRASKSNGLHFGMTMYGDAFYRRRPFDIQTLSTHVDEMMIMAYDFSKSYGEPGPNFPLEGREQYGYDIKTMIEDFASAVPREKLSVIFGMYGYDWTVDEKGRPLKPGNALSLNEIEKKYLENCGNCSIVRAELAQETKIVAGDHIIWFEDLESAKKKQEYSQSQGIGSFAYWAFGYF